MTRSSAGPFLITGSGGQVGYEVARELSVLGPVLVPHRDQLNLADVAGVRSYVRAAKPIAIINAAAFTQVDAAETDAAAAHAINAIAPLVLAEEAKRLSIPVIHFSTDYVFDGRKKTAYLETDATNPINVYGQTKLAGEEGIASACDSWITFRCSWVYSLRSRNFLLTILRLTRESEVVRIVDDQIGCPTWARMIAVSTFSVLAAGLRSEGGPTEYLRQNFGVFHLSGPNSASWFDFAREIVALCPTTTARVEPIPTSSYPTAARRPRNSLLDSRRASEVFGITLPPWESQLRMCLAP